MARHGLFTFVRMMMFVSPSVCVCVPQVLYVCLYVCGCIDCKAKWDGWMDGWMERKRVRPGQACLGQPRLFFHRSSPVCLREPDKWMDGWMDDGTCGWNSVSRYACLTVCVGGEGDGERRRAWRRGVLVVGWMDGAPYLSVGAAAYVAASKVHPSCAVAWLPCGHIYASHLFSV